ncbi:hypothetical protein C0989_002302 [Termitomyces sp. Mn162]|nr:hypothetical protein C0989_002302 [Termitomyces sp. Mn162]KAH0582796.1 hypothetical protein H2248_010705 [Termitomyces sp. 'cryptogamus']
MAAQYIHPTGRQLDRRTIYDALAKVVKAHTALGVRLAGDLARDPVFERLEKVDLSEVVEFSDTCGLEATIQGQLLRKFDVTSNLPLWRVVISGDGTVCFAWHHGIGDGKSGLAFHRAFLSSLQSGESRDGNCIVIPLKNALAPPIESLVDLSPSWLKVASTFFGLFAPVSWTLAAKSWTGSTVPNEITFQNHVRLIVFSPDVASTLLILCRSHGATITSMFHALAASVISDLVLSEKYATISSLVPISLRGLSGTSNDAMCNHVSSLHSYTKVNPTFSWEHASQYAAELRSYVKKSVEDIGMLSYLNGKYDKFFQGMLGKKRAAGFELSNVGRFGFEKSSADGPKWSIGHMVFAQCDVVVGAALKLNVVGDALGGITISVIWGAGSVSDVFADQFVTKFKDSIEKLRSEGAAIQG